jgi:EPS-associated MarR family transcriptional regulator
MVHDVSDEVGYRLLKYLSLHPEASQRELARELGVSLGKANYCLHALVARGLVKIRNFKSSPSKTAYVYILTRRGMEAKINVTYAFLRRKMAEYDRIVSEIERLRDEVQAMSESTAEQK